MSPSHQGSSHFATNIQGASASSRSPPPLPLPRLGDFSKLRPSTLINPYDPRENLSTTTKVGSPQNDGLSPHNVKASTKLGNFNKLFNEFQSPSLCNYSKFSFPLRTPETSSEVATSGLIEASFSPSPAYYHNPLEFAKHSTFSVGDRDISWNFVQEEKHNESMPEVVSLADNHSKSKSEHDSDANPPSLTPSSTPPSLTDNPVSSPTSLSGKKLSHRQRVPLVQSSKDKSVKRHLQLGGLLSFYSTKDGSSGNVRKIQRTDKDKHELLMMELIQHRSLDKLMAKNYPSVSAKGIHVFVDMSNIDIGFQNALKRRYSLDESVHFSPLPHLNLQFLTYVLVRDRPVVAMNVGCSAVPRRQEPRYVRELRRLGYQVDLRERKRIEDMPWANAAMPNIRFIEELVDETLQIRIAESVMKYFQEQGTIVLATGDAKPAQFSDGFFAYVERALKMGWNIEVISWTSSLSSAWTNWMWKSQWGNRFRIIKLDEFLDNLVA